ncbi:DUF4962 domain-containing protein [Phocaeicola sartorii]|uniref:DUF4962 domain-containing protein n=1 Tax=Phocaeicola sartorii TaxID=671267 RepID=UPI002432F3E2|nr:DUF4962 domain-containing protein [Phocaeicola sartorii]
MKSLSTLLILTVTLAITACSDNAPITPVPDEQSPESTLPDAYHDKVRTQPYPKTDNEIYLNPAPFIVPKEMKQAERLQFNVSRDTQFSGPETILSEARPWCMFNPHRTLETGLWYWRFRSVTSSGQPGAWSDTYSFEVKDETPRFVTPPFADFLGNAPRIHPRLYAFLDDKIEAARKRVTSHPEYGQLTTLAATALKADFSAPYNQTADLRLYTDYLYQAWHLTLRTAYRNKLHDILSTLLQTPPTEAQLFATNFGATDIASAYLTCYDALYNKLSATERAATEKQLMRVAEKYYPQHCGIQENHIFDNHFWQQNMRVLFQIAYLLYDKVNYSGKAIEMLEYYYELWTARAPASGFNRDGVWHNGTGYFINNVRTLQYLPLLYSYIARKDFLQHPWYRNAGRSLVYTWPPESRSLGFGDGSEKYDSPQRQRAAFADFLARETGDSYAGWYAAQCTKSLQRDPEMRLYRMAANRTYETQLPASTEKMIWYKDAGEVVMHSNLADTDHNLSLAFRSSTFASGSHTTACQNSFNLLFKGTDVYRSSGYYLNFSDAHNLMSYRHTRAHNTILVNGIGQPYSMKGYGNIVRAMGGNHISYCLGDASNAYSGITDDPMWTSAFAAAGISQTPEYGFGVTPLTRYRRHVLMLHPDILVIYDELEAASPVRWSWLLHSPTRFELNEAEQLMGTRNDEKGFIAVTGLFSSHPYTATQTDAFTVPPTPTPNPAYPNQWHFTAETAPCAANRYLAIIQVKGTDQTAHAIRRNGDTFTIGRWSVEATLDTSRPASLVVRNSDLPATFSYGAEHPTPSGEIYIRRYPQSSVLYDEKDGIYHIMEETDRPAISSRTAL